MPDARKVGNITLVCHIDFLILGNNIIYENTFGSFLFPLFYLYQLLEVPQKTKVNSSDFLYGCNPRKTMLLMEAKL